MHTASLQQLETARKSANLISGQLFISHDIEQPNALDLPMLRQKRISQSINRTENRHENALISFFGLHK